MYSTERPYTPIPLPKIIPEDRAVALFEKMIRRDSPTDGSIEQYRSVDQLLILLSTLDLRHQTVLILRYGLDGSDPRTQGQVARIMNVTRERIRQIEAFSLARMRREAKVAHEFQILFQGPDYTQVRECLARAGIISIADLASRTEDQLLMIPRFGDTALELVKQKLAERGLYLAEVR